MAQAQDILNLCLTSNMADKRYMQGLTTIAAPIVSSEGCSGLPAARPSLSNQRRVRSSVFGLSPLSATSSLHRHHPDKRMSMRKGMQSQR